MTKLSKSILDTLNDRAPRFLYKEDNRVIVPYNILSKDEQSKIFEGLLKLDASIYCEIQLPFDNNKQISVSNLNLLKAYIRITDSLNNEGYDRTASNILESLHDKRIDIKNQSLTFHNIIYSLRYKDEKSRQKVNEGWESLNIIDINEIKDGVYFYYSEKIPNNENVLKILVFVPHRNPEK
jgi:hypothetical protein